MTPAQERTTACAGQPSHVGLRPRDLHAGTRPVRLRHARSTKRTAASTGVLGRATRSPGFAHNSFRHTACCRRSSHRTSAFRGALAPTTRGGTVGRIREIAGVLALILVSRLAAAEPRTDGASPQARAPAVAHEPAPPRVIGAEAGQAPERPKLRLPADTSPRRHGFGLGDVR